MKCNDDIKCNDVLIIIYCCYKKNMVCNGMCPDVLINELKFNVVYHYPKNSF